MVTINLPPGADDDASLERWAQAIRARYAASGRIVEARTVRSAGAEAGGWLIAAELQAGGVSEVVVARLFVREGRPIGVVYSRRHSGDEATARSAAWLTEHRAEVEANLLGWTGLPPLEALDRLPQSSH